MTQQKEMSILSDSKSGVVATSPWVRIPPSPPGLVDSLFCGAIFLLSELSSLGVGVVDGLLILEYQKSSPTHQPYPFPAANSSVGSQTFSAVNELSSNA